MVLGLFVKFNSLLIEMPNYCDNSLVENWIKLRRSFRTFCVFKCLFNKLIFRRYTLVIVGIEATYLYKLNMLSLTAYISQSADTARHWLMKKMFSSTISL